jgi:hypothetical protein
MSRVFTNNYRYWAVTLVIVNNYGYLVDIYGYWSITMDIGLIVQTACHSDGPGNVRKRLTTRTQKPP